MDNTNFERDQKNFFKKVEGVIEQAGQMLEMDKFANFGETYGKKMIEPPEMPCIESVSKQLRVKITNVKEFNIPEKSPCKRN